MRLVTLYWQQMTLVWLPMMMELLFLTADEAGDAGLAADEDGDAGLAVDDTVLVAHDAGEAVLAADEAGDAVLAAHDVVTLFWLLWKLIFLSTK